MDRCSEELDTANESSLSSFEGRVWEDRERQGEERERGRERQEFWVHKWLGNCMEKGLKVEEKSKDWWRRLKNI